MIEVIRVLASKILLGAFFQFYISFEFVEVLVLS